MAQPNSILNTRGQSTDSLVGVADGTMRAKLGVGSKTHASITPELAWQGVATHPDGGTFVASDGVAVLAGVDGTTVRKFIVDASGRPLVVLVPTAGAITDRSGTITTGGTRQEVMAANTARKYLLFQNVSDTDMWVDIGVNAVADSPSIKVPAGGGLVFEGSFVPSARLDVICATTGKKYTAKEG